MSYWFEFVTVFFSVLFADVAYAMYFYMIGKHQSLKAGIWGALVHICAAYSITEFVHDKTLIIAAALGSIVGTIVTVEYNRRKKLANDTNKKI